MRTVMAAVLVLAMVAALASAAQAGVIDRRQHRQLQRIAAGIRCGDLTRGEAARLLAEQAWIRLEERYYRSTGGGIEPREWLDLQRDLNRASRHIYRQRHDAQRR
ncbi:MAG: hypothetical protein QN120_13565 [Armatimonadota bacterium]|nr:hypothetical protein [Armatimonadota bacterium]